MTTSFHYLLYVLALMSLLAQSSCKKTNKPGDDFDQKALFQNIADGQVIPGYQNLKTATDGLKAKALSFNAAPDSTGLTDLKMELISAWNVWQNVSAFEFGPAETVFLRSSLNTFPADTAQIASNISTGTWDLAIAANADAKGFPALDFLLFGANGQDSTLLALFTTEANASSRRNYLAALITEMSNKVNTVLAGWEATGGNYRETFINNTGTDVGSSLGMLVNQMNQDFEQMKNSSIGIPAGVKTLGNALPEKTEAYFSGRSASLLKTHLGAHERIFMGTGLNGGSGIGLYDYLLALEAQYNGGTLAGAIQSGFTTARGAVDALTDPFSQQVINDNPTVLTAYQDCQALVVMLKSDMPSALGVLITYTDNDGD